MAQVEWSARPLVLGLTMMLNAPCKLHQPPLVFFCARETKNGTVFVRIKTHR